MIEKKKAKVKQKTKKEKIKSNICDSDKIINTQEEMIVEVLLDSEVTGLVMNSKFTRKQKFKFKKNKKD